MPKRKRTLKVGSEGVEAPKLGSVRECRELHEKLWRKKETRLNSFYIGI